MKQIYTPKETYFTPLIADFTLFLPHTELKIFSFSGNIYTLRINRRHVGKC